MIRFGRMLIPKYFYFILFAGSLTVQLTIFRAEIITLFHILAFGVNVIAALFLYETVAALSKAKI
jgi:hypothetical protein